LFNYQSDKYTATTATSEVVTVTYTTSNTIELKQLNKNQLKVTFEAPVTALNASDVSVVQKMELLAGNFEFPVYVADAKLASDGMSATVTLDDDFMADMKYVVTVKGYEEESLIASYGHPVRFEIYSPDATDNVILTNSVPSALKVKFYDAKDVEVEPENANVLFRVETRSTDGKYYISGNNTSAKLTIKENGKPVVVIAEYQGRVENGKRVGQLEAKQEFVAVAEKEIKLAGMGQASLTGFETPSLTMRYEDKPQLYVKFLNNDGSEIGPVTYGGFVDNYQLSFTSASPSYAVIATDGTITAFKSGEAYFYVNLAQKNSTGGYGTPTPVAVVTVIIEPTAAFKSASLDNYTIILGTSDEEAAFHTGKLTLSAVDTYGNEWEITDGVDIKCLTDGFDGDAFDDAIVPAYVNKKAELNIDACKILEVLASKDAAPAEGQATALYFKAVYSNYVQEFAVMIQVPGAAEGNYVEIVASGNNIDAVRINEEGKTADKEIVFEVYELNNEVKVGRLDFVEYPAAAKNVSDGTFCYKILKDGEALASKFVTPDLNNGKVTVKLSKTEDGKVVYAGEGTYTFVLEQCIGEGDDAVLVQMYSADVYSYIGDQGAYKLVRPVTGKVANTQKLSILKCFEITDRNGKLIVKADGTLNTAETKYADYEVKMTAPENSGYVYVEKITFAEKLDENTTVYYEVAIDTVLEIK